MATRKRRRYFLAGLALCILLQLGALTGCGALQSDLAVEAGLKQILPEAVILDVETEVGSDHLKSKRFTIENKGVRFTYENTQRRESFFNTVVTVSSNDYCQQLFTHFSREIGEIKETYQVEVEIISDSFVQVRHDVADMEELADGVDAMEEICQLLRDYLPKAQLNWFSFQLSLLTDYGENQQYFIYQREDWDAAYARQLLYLDFKADVEEGLVSDVGLSQELLDAIPQKYIRSLYINGKPYQSEDYEICFLYNILDETYYTRVGFGVKLNYNGGVEDYLQREIIESYYPEAEYTISPRAQTSTYTIGADQYLVKRRDDGLTFFKNDTELQIAAYQELSGTHTGATYYFWVSVDDFATLLGMTVDKVEEDGVYLLLPTSSVPSDQAPSDVPVSLSIR